MDPIIVSLESVQKINQVLINAAAGLAYVITLKILPSSIKNMLKPLQCILMGYNQTISPKVEAAAANGIIDETELRKLELETALMLNKCSGTLNG